MKCDLVSIAALAATFTSVAAHTIITYPGWRGDNLISNESFPYGMQWAYPCKLTASDMATIAFSPC